MKRFDQNMSNVWKKSLKIFEMNKIYKKTSKPIDKTIMKELINVKDKK